VSRSHGGAQVLDATRRFCQLLSERLRLPVTSVVTRDYDHLLEGVQMAGVDLAWMPPLIHARGDGLLAAVVQRGGAVTYRAALLTRGDSDFETVADLAQARAAWTDRASASGFLFPKLHLLAEGIEPAEETMYGSIAVALGAVLDDKADLCACFVRDDPSRAMEDVLRNFPHVKGKLRVLAVTDSIPPDGVVLAPGIEGTLQARLRDLLLNVHDSPDGAARLRDLFSAEKLVPLTTPVSRAIERLRALAEKHL
jgi:ABC-type phosphate/phosphonate transport system substrate-binding protein